MSANSLNLVRRKVEVLQQQAKEAEERARLLQKEVDEERRLREQAEAEVASLNRRIQQVEEERDRALQKLALEALEALEQEAGGARQGVCVYVSMSMSSFREAG